jgi:hypothetical protein
LSDHRPQDSLTQDVALATITVRRDLLDSVAAIYGETLGWTAQQQLTLDDGLADMYRISRGRRAIVLGAPGEARGRVRLLEGETPPSPPMGTFGWTSMEVTVASCDGIHEIVAASPNFRVNGIPRDLMFGGGPPGQRAMQAVGPAGEQFYLTEILRNTAGQELAVPPAGSRAGAVFIAVLGVPIALWDVSVSFYGNVLGMWGHLDVMANLRAANAESGWPDGTLTRIAALRPRGETRIELDGYPAQATVRERRIGELPAGFGLCSFAVPDLEVVLAAARQRGVPISGPARSAQAPYDGMRAAVLAAPAGELVEVIGP